MRTGSNTTSKERSIWVRLALWAAAISGGIVLAIGGLFLWALTATDTSLLARGLIWGDASTRDWTRLPSRTFARSESPMQFRPAPSEWMSELKIGGEEFDSFLARTDTTAIVILHGDELIYERYFNGGEESRQVPTLSVSKSFTSALLGIAIGEGLIASLDDPITKYVPELAGSDPRFGEITLRHLAGMSSGIRFERYASPWSDASITYWSPDLRAAALDCEIAEKPGVRFSYNDYNTVLIGMALERASGMSVSEYLESRLWQPMGAEFDGSWSLDSRSSEFEQMSVGVNGRPRDLARFGLLYLNEGRSGTQQVVPASWVRETTITDIETNPSAEYQYGWWINEHRGGAGYSAEGNLGQFICVYPDQNLVLARFGNSTGGIYWTRLLAEIAGWISNQL